MDTVPMEQFKIPTECGIDDLWDLANLAFELERCNENDYPYTLPLNVDIHVNRAEALALSTPPTNPPALPEVVKVDISVEIFLKTYIFLKEIKNSHSPVFLPAGCTSLADCSSPSNALSVL